MATNKSIYKGKVYLVGAGPGDPELISVKGARLLREAQCIIYDFLASSRLLSYAAEGVETIYVGKKGSVKSITQPEITALIIDRATRGKTVVRLKGGDPFIFGRGAEEAEALVRAKIPFEIVPGVTSAIAAPAYAGIPLTHRDFASSVTFITGQENPLKERKNIAWDRLSTGRGTLVFLMGWKNLPLITKKLLKNGWPEDTPVALVRWGTLPVQKTVTGTLSSIVKVSKKAGIKPPVITVVGDVVKLREDFNWFESRPLFGKTILVTRTEEQAGEFTEILEQDGAIPLSFPTIKTMPPPSWRPLDNGIKNLSSYDWVIFTSVNGVRYFFDRLTRLGKDLRELKGVKICAIGPRTTRAIREFNIKVDLTPKVFRAEAILKALGKSGIKGKRFILPRALKAREILPDTIKKLGGTIDVLPSYRTVRPRKKAAEIREKLFAGEITAITFTSSSTVTNFMKFFKKNEAELINRKTRIACIGPITADTAESLGLRVDIMPESYTIPSLTEAIASYFLLEKRKSFV